MSVEKIIQESVNKNPLGMKEALEEELRSRLALALEAKMNNEDDDDDEDDDELDEAKTDIYHKHMLKALGKSRLPKNHSYTSATGGDLETGRAKRESATSRGNRIKEGKVKDAMMGDSEKMTKAEFAKKYGEKAADKMYESVEGKMPSKSHIMKMCKDGKTKAEICKMHPNCDQPKLKAMIDDCKNETSDSKKK